MRVFKGYRLRRGKGDEGTIAVMAAIIIPVVLTVIALALASLVWGTSETEVQRASDQAALQGAASALLVPTAGISANPVFPTLNSVAGLTGASAPANCSTVGNAYTAVASMLSGAGGVLGGLGSALPGLPSTTVLQSALNQAMNGLDPTLKAALTASSSASCQPIVVTPTVTDPTQGIACSAAKTAMSASRAPWSNDFFSGTGGSVPDCDTNARVRAGLYDDENNLLGIPDVSATTLGSSTTTLSVTSTYNQVQSALAGLGVRLQTTLPNTLCPKVQVSIDQPVKGPIFQKVSVPNGRSTAKRVIKNAVIVPVFNGATITDPTATVSGQQVPPLNLNTTILGPLQTQLVGALDAVNAAVNKALGDASIPVTSPPVTLPDGTTVVPASQPGVKASNLNLLSCLTNTVSDLYNPPVSSGSAPSTTQVMNQVLSQASLDGDVVQVISVGVQNCPGAVASVNIYSCLLPALTGVAGAATGLYDVPVLDVTPAVINDVGNGNFQAVPVTATQARGAFRAVLVRGSNDTRFIP